MRKFSTSDGLSLAYRDEGDGIPVLCLAGLTRNGEDFDFVAPYLAGTRMIRLDSRGRGSSDHDPDWQNYQIAVEARDAMELLDHLGLDRVAVIGTSRGGFLAMTIAAVAKDRLLGVFLNDIGPELMPEGLELIERYVGRRPKYESIAEAAADRPRTVPEFHNVPASRWREEAERLWVERPDGLDLNYDRKLRDGTVAALATEQPDLWPLFDCLADLPLALVRGENSKLLSRDCAKKMQERRPDMIYKEVADRGHVPFLDEPECLAALKDWLEILS
ncbi:MAG: alpha/beta hydrolase [Rhodobacteraceae bacterium]|nr:alpha/beta hydrolase [Paracoccaceae bacterium]